MTRKDYLLIAKALHKARTEITSNFAEEVQFLAQMHQARVEFAFSEALSERNPRFDTDMFLTNCREGVPG